MCSMIDMGEVKVPDYLGCSAFTPGWNACNGNNGGCSHLCLALPTIPDSNQTHICACPTHYELNWDNKTCTGK